MKRCNAFATAEKYDVDELSKYLRSNGFDPKFYDDVINVTIDSINSEDQNSEVFFFPYGCFVTWGMTDDHINQIFEYIENFAINTYAKHTEDHSNYEINASEKTRIVEEEDLIILEEDDSLMKLSISHALSQSTKLEAFETKVAASIATTRPISEELAIKGKVSLSRKKLSQQIGALFIVRNSIILDTDILDLPEFFWRRPKYEEFYLLAAGYLDINTRMDILHRKLEAIHDLYNILTTELNHIHSAKLEIVITYLISIEVILTVLKDVLKWI